VSSEAHRDSPRFKAVAKKGMFPTEALRVNRTACRSPPP